LSEHFGFCNKCEKLSPASYEEHNGTILLVKECSDCGRTETIVSSDPVAWRAKRKLARLDSDAGCKLDCRTCPVTHSPRTVFVDITNRCNQNCPICIANIPSMGFKFEPPMAYFTKVFQYLGGLDPKPSIKLFGGEPTVRKDLPEIIAEAKRADLSVSIVTNGLRFADEEYAKELLKSRAKIIFGFDGRDEKVYSILRGDANCYQKKLQGLENIRKYGKRKLTIMCVVASGINDHLIADLFHFCHERGDLINALEFIPLTRSWEAGSIDADGAEITAMEDVEKILAASVSGGKLEFLPAGLTPFNNISKYLPVPRLTFAGAHPNCESVSFLVSDGAEYRPITHFMKGDSLYAAVDDFVERDSRFGKRMDRLRKGLLGRLGLERITGMLLGVHVLSATIMKNANLRNILGEYAWLKLANICFGLLLGGKGKRILRRNTHLRNILRIVVLPFEETRTLDSAKLKRCPAAFAYEDPDTRKIRTTPVCAWGLQKNEILKGIMANYADFHEEVVANKPDAQAN